MPRNIPGSVSNRTQAQKNGESASVLDFDRTGYCNKAANWSYDGIVGPSLDRISGAVTRFTNTVGAVVNLLVTSGGGGYTQATIVITDATGSGASYSAVIANGSVVATTLMSGGSGYSPHPTVTVTGDGSGAVLLPMVSQFPCVGALIYVCGAGPTSRTYAGVTYSGGQTSYTTNHNDAAGPTLRTFGPGAFNLSTTIASLADEVIAGSGIYKTAVFASPANQVPAGVSALFTFGIDASPAFLAAVTSGIADLKIPIGCYLVNAGINLAQFLNGNWHYVERVYSEGHTSPVIIFTNDNDAGFKFEGPWLLQGDPHFGGEVTFAPTIEGLTIYASLCAIKFGYFAEDMVTDPITKNVVKAGTLVGQYICNAMVRRCDIHGYYDYFIFDPKRLSKDEADDPWPEELTGLGGVGILFPKGGDCIETSNWIRNVGIAIRDEHASHMVSEHSMHFYCGVIWMHHVGPFKDAGGGDNCHYSHNKPIGWKRAGIFVPPANRWWGSSAGGFNSARIINCVFEQTEWCTDGTAAERCIVDRDGTAGLWIDNCTLPGAFGNTNGAECIQLSPGRFVYITNCTYAASASNSPQVRFDAKGYNFTWQTNVFWRNNMGWASFEFPCVQQADLDPLFFSPSNQLTYTGGNTGNTVAPGAMSDSGATWPFVKDPIAGWCFAPNVLNPSYYFYFNMPTTSLRFLIEIEGVVHDVGPSSGDYEYGYLAVGYIDDTLGSAWPFDGIRMLGVFTGFVNDGTAQRKQFYLDMPLTGKDLLTEKAYTINPSVDNNPKLLVEFVTSQGASAPGYGFRIRSVRVTPIDTTAPPPYLNSAELAIQAEWKNALGETLWSPLDQGAKADGDTDDTAAILAAITSYGYLYVPLGKTFAHKGLTITTGLRIFGGGELRRIDDGPNITIDGTANGATGATIENVRILSYVNSGTTPAIHLLNAVQARISNIYLSNNNGPGVLLEGNGTGIGYCEQCVIEGLYVVGGITDVIQIKAAPAVWNVCNIVITNGRWISYGGWGIDNQTKPGANISLIGTILIPNVANQTVQGTVNCVGNQGVADNITPTDLSVATIETSGKATLASAEVTGDTTLDGTLEVKGAATLDDNLVITGTGKTLTISDLDTRESWRVALGETLYSPLDQGAKADALTDDSTAILAAIAAYGYLYVPLGKLFAHKGLSFTNSVRIFGGGELRRLDDGPNITIDGTADGAVGSLIEDVRIVSYVNSGTTPAIHLLNTVQARVSNVYLANNNGPGVLLEGNGTGIGFCEQSIIEGLYVVGGISDVIQIKALPAAWNSGNVVISNGRWISYSGWGINNLIQGSLTVVMGTIFVPNVAGNFVNGYVTLIGNNGPADNITQPDLSVTTLETSGKATLGTLEVTGDAVVDGTLAVHGGAEITGDATLDAGLHVQGDVLLDGALTLNGVGKALNFNDATTRDNWRASLGVSDPAVGANLFSPLDHGAFADGNTPDNAAIQAAIDSHGYLYLPYGSVFAITALRFTTGIRIFGGGTLILKGDGPAITVDGTSTGGATGMRVEDIHINQANWNHTNVQPVIHLLNIAQGVIDGVSAYNQSGSTPGPIILLQGDGNSFGFCEQIKILRLNVIGGASDIIQVKANPDAWHVGVITVAFGLWMNYSGFAVNQIARGNAIILIGNMVVTSGGTSNNFLGITCIGNVGIPDNFLPASPSFTTLDTTGKAILASLEVTGAATLNTTLDVKGDATVEGSLQVIGGITGATAHFTAAATLDDDLSVTGVATLASAQITGGMNVGGNVDITGFALASGGIESGDAATMDTTLHVKGAATLDDSLVISGASKTLTISDATTKANWKNTLGITAAQVGAKLFSPLDQGAAGDGSTDDHSAIIAAITTYGYLYVPPGVNFATSPISRTAGFRIFGQGYLSCKGDGPLFTLDGTSSGGATGLKIEGVTFLQSGWTSAQPVIKLVNVAQALLSRTTVFNSNGSANGPAIWLEGNGTSFGYTEQIAIDGLRVIGGATDILSVHSSPAVWNCGIVTLTNSLLMNFSGYVVNNVTQGNSFVIANCIVVGGAGAFTGSGVTCYGNIGVSVAIPDNFLPASPSFTTLTTTGKATLASAEVMGNTTLDGSLEVKQGATLDTTLEVKGAATLDSTLDAKGDVTLEGNVTISGASKSLTISDVTTKANWKTALGIVTVTTPQAMLYSPLDKGAAGNGVTDDTAAILAAITSYGYLYLPPQKAFHVNDSTGLVINPTNVSGFNGNLRIFGGGILRTNSGGAPVLTIDGSNNSGASGCIIEDIQFNRYSPTGAAPLIQLINCVNHTIYNCTGSNGNGGFITLVGNGGGNWGGYCEQITINGVYFSGWMGDVVQINSTPDANHVNSIIVMAGRFGGYGGYVVNNVAKGSVIVVMGCIAVPNNAGWYINANGGTVNCYGNTGIPDNIGA